MSTSIQIGIPTISKEELKSTISVQLLNGQSISAEITADLSELLPWFNTASAVANDFAFLSFFVYGIDRLIPRRANSVDGWAREFYVSMPVYNVAKWNASKNLVEKLLSFMTGDYWKLNFLKNNLALPQRKLDAVYDQKIAQVNLFSGGLDSLIGAIDSMEKSKLPILFISHYDSMMHGPKKDQGDVGGELTKKYSQLFMRLPSVKVFLSKNPSGASETTSRSRSLLFIGLALILANAKGLKIIVPENGTVSVNYPLSASRRSACSTRTTHPALLNLIFELWKALGIANQIENPYRFKTKGEMVKECKNQIFLNSILNLSNSCGKRGHRAHWDKSGTHCGICMPCIYRRVSLISTIDKTDYGNEINDLSFTAKKGQDVGALLEFIKGDISERDIKFELIANGLNDLPHLKDYIGLIQRTRKELALWVKKEGNIKVKNKAGL